MNAFVQPSLFLFHFHLGFKIAALNEVRFAMFGCCWVWPHDGTHQSNEHYSIIGGAPANGEELRLILRTVVLRFLVPSIPSSCFNPQFTKISEGQWWCLSHKLKKYCGGRTKRVGSTSKKHIWRRGKEKRIKRHQVARKLFFFFFPGCAVLFCLVLVFTSKDWYEHLRIGKGLFFQHIDEK